LSSGSSGKDRRGILIYETKEEEVFLEVFLLAEEGLTVVASDNDVVGDLW
jgi:hypothetical protein